MWVATFINHIKCVTDRIFDAVAIVQLLSPAWLFATPWTVAHQASLSSTVSQHAYMLSQFTHVQLFTTLWTIAQQAPVSMGFSRQEYWSGLPCLPHCFLGCAQIPVHWISGTISSSTTPSPFAFNLSQNQGLFQWVSSSYFITGEGNGNPLQYSCLENPMDRGAWQAMVHGVTESDTTELTKHAALCIKWPKDRSFSFSITLSNEYLRLIPFRIDWFDLLAVQVTLKSLLQHHNSKASLLRHSAFFMDQLLHLFMTTKETITLTIQTFVCKVRSLFLIHV